MADKSIVSDVFSGANDDQVGSGDTLIASNQQVKALPILNKLTGVKRLRGRSLQCK